MRYEHSALSVLACRISITGFLAGLAVPYDPTTAPAVAVVSPVVVRVVQAMVVPWTGPGDAGVYPLVGPVYGAAMMSEPARALLGRRK